jgi:hypothetical protein
VTNCQAFGAFSQCVTVTPDAATNPVGTTHTVTESVTQSDPTGVFSCPPGVGTTVALDTATITSGPNSPRTIPFTGTVTLSNALTGDCAVSGSFTYTDTGGAGTDTISLGSSVPFTPLVMTQLTITKTWLAAPAPVPPAPACPTGQQLVSGHCVTPFAGFAFALGGQGGYTQPCDPGTCPSGQDAAAADNAPDAPDDLTPPSSPNRSGDTASDDVLGEALTTG